jgi:transcriptional regulator with XRE-family HTH domain
VIPLITALTNARRAAGLHQQHIADGLELAAQAGHKMVSDWEHGRSVPRVGHACGYAQLVGRRIVVVRDEQLVGDLLDALPRLMPLINESGLTVRDLADGLFQHPVSLRSTIRRAGPGTRLTTAQNLLGAIRCTLDLREVDHG